MPNWIENRLYVKNTGPEFDTLKAIFTREDSPFNKLCPIPDQLVSETETIEHLIEKSRHIKQRRDYWRPKINQVIEKLNLFGFNFSPLKDLNYSDFEMLMSDVLGKPDGSLKQRVKMWLRNLEEERNLKKFGAKDWYDWSILNWGTKWDACFLKIIYAGEDEFCIEFETAWNSPSGIYTKLGLDFPRCIFMTYTWSIESNFMACASRVPDQGWVVEELGPILDKRNKALNPLPKPSKSFLEFAKQFKTQPPPLFTELQEIPAFITITVEEM